MDVDPIPEGHLAVTPSLVCTPCGEAIDWYVAVFDAEEVGDRMVGPDGKVGHAEIRIGGCPVMLGDEWPDGPIVSPTTLGGSATALFLYRADADTVWARALDNGAEVVFPFEKQFYGHEAGRIRDPFGHLWGIGRQVELVSDDQMDERVEQFYADLEG